MWILLLAFSACLFYQAGARRSGGLVLAGFLVLVSGLFSFGSWLVQIEETKRLVSVSSEEKRWTLDFPKEEKESCQKELEEDPWQGGPLRFRLPWQSE